MKNHVTLVLVHALLLTGCATTPPPPPPTDPDVRQKLIADTDAVSAAATRADRAATDMALATLARDVATAQAQGKLDPAKAHAILTAADRIAEDARTFPPPNPATIVITVPQPVPPPPAPPPAPQPGNVAPEPKKPEAPQPKEPRPADRSPPEQDDN